MKLGRYEIKQASLRRLADDVDLRDKVLELTEKKIGESPESTATQREVVKLLENPHLIEAIPPTAEEAIIQFVNRPVLLVRANSFDPADAGIWTARLAQSQKLIETALVSIGRIEVTNNPRFEWLGTGWLVDDDVIVTNRHVAHEFGEKIGAGFGFRRSILGPMSANIDFREEFEVALAAEFEIAEILQIVDRPGPDMALLRIRWTRDASAEKRAPISLGDVEAVRQAVATIGYPAKDSRTHRSDEMDKIFADVYDVKRLAPGEVATLPDEGVFAHDCTTLGGNSGSVVLDLDSGKAIGLHFAGLEERANYAVEGRVVRDRLDQISRRRTTQVRGFEDLAMELVPRNCRLKAYEAEAVGEFEIDGDFVAYASPDSTYAVTKRFFEAARKSILIGIYDFSADHMKELVLEAVDRGVKVSLMLDIDSDDERAMFDDLAHYGVECVPAPSCANKNPDSRFFSSSHEKVIVIDELWSLVQSGNYSVNSIPRNDVDGGDSRNFRYGNRDTGVAIKSEKLARFFRRVLLADMKLDRSSDDESAAGSSELPDASALLEAPKSPPPRLFASKTFRPDEPVRVRPVLTPDNYMKLIPGWLKTAKRSIYIEQQYIRTNQPLIKKLLESIDATRDKHPDLDVRVILARPFGGGDSFRKSIDEMLALQQYGLKPGEHVRILNPEHFVHCHNKLIVVDGKSVLLSSQNWSDSAVGKNREAGVIVDYPDLARYFADIFETDWETAIGIDDELAPAPEFVTTTTDRAAGQRFVRVAYADIADV